jgi:amidophosphoribosyltransferase
MADDLGEKCALFGVHHHPEAAKLTYLGLYALQHRGQESSGIVSHGHRAQSLLDNGL